MWVDSYTRSTSIRFPNSQVQSWPRQVGGTKDISIFSSGKGDNICTRSIVSIRNTVSLGWWWCKTFFCPLTTREGPIVRIAPNEINIKDVDYYDTLYALGVKRDKVPYMIDIFGTKIASKVQHTYLIIIPSYPTVFGTEKHELHRSRRMVLSPFFSKRSVTRLESVIQEKVRRMCDTLSACKDRRQDIQLRHALTATTVDITTEYCKLLL